MSNSSNHLNTEGGYDYAPPDTPIPGRYQRPDVIRCTKDDAGDVCLCPDARECGHAYPRSGYTPHDLQQMREDGRAELVKYEMGLMDLVGADVYFAVKNDDEGNGHEEA